MRKIGVIYGMENTFPPALVDRINSMRVDEVRAEHVHIGGIKMAEPSGYRVIVDRISHDIAFYRAYLKNAALNGARWTLPSVPATGAGLVRTDAANAENALAANGWALKDHLAKVGKPFDRQEWYVTPPTVTAYYVAQQNLRIYQFEIAHPDVRKPPPD